MSKNLDQIYNFTEFSPLCKAMNMQVDRVEPYKGRLTLPYDDKLVGDPQTRIIHGGAVSALLDTTCGVAVMAHPDGNYNTATIDLRIDYMRPALPDLDVIAEAEVYHTTNTVAFLRAKAWTDNEDKPVAIATGAFVFEAMKKK